MEENDDCVVVAGDESTVSIVTIPETASECESDLFNITPVIEIPVEVDGQINSTVSLTLDQFCRIPMPNSGSDDNRLNSILQEREISNGDGGVHVSENSQGATESGANRDNTQTLTSGETSGDCDLNDENNEATGEEKGDSNHCYISTKSHTGSKDEITDGVDRLLDSTSNITMQSISTSDTGESSFVFRIEQSNRNQLDDGLSVESSIGICYLYQ